MKGNVIMKASKQNPTFIDGFLALFLFGIIGAYLIIAKGIPPHIAMIIGVAIASLFALRCGSSWKTIEDGMINGMTQALGAVVILLLIGMLIGTWICSGVVPAMVCYGLRLLSPKTFLVSAMLLCMFVSLALGSWGAAGTIGIALMGISDVLGFPPSLTAGAIVSGSYIGDRISPITDMTNLVSSVTQADVFQYIRKVLMLNILSISVAGIIYYFIGIQYSSDIGIEGEILELIGIMEQEFKIGVIDFFPLVVLLTCILLKVPAIPSLFFGLVSAGILAVAVQGKDIVTVLNSCFYGYVGNTGHPVIDSLLTSGGIEAMLYSLTLSLSAMMFGGVMEETGLMQAVMIPIVRRAKNIKTLTTSVILSTFVVNAVLPDAYVAVMLPGKMFQKAFEDRNISRSTFGCAVGSGACSLSPLIPWNTCGVFMTTVLGVQTMSYNRYAFVNILVPIAAVLIVFLRPQNDEVKLSHQK